MKVAGAYWRDSNNKMLQKEWNMLEDKERP